MTGTTQQRAVAGSSAENRIRATAKKVGMLPAVALQAMELSRDPDCSIREFSQVVERDPSLAADILSISNSVLYSSGQPVLNLNQAVVRLGFNQCYHLILSASMSALMKNVPLEEEWIRESLCRHGFVTGLLAVKLNSALNLRFSGEEFTVGLMHDFGRILLAVAFPDRFADLDDLSFDERHPDFLQREQAFPGLDHCDVCGLFAEMNGLPGTLIDTIRHHHDPAQATADRRLAALIALSDDMANYAQRVGNGEGYKPDASFDFSLLGTKNTNADVVASLTEIAPTLIENSVFEAIEIGGY
ncbi:MAG: HDOD domain-containing protein [Planctomycetaceae bacterium]|nr:HDOD domain-containing protein [Planctomycetaceae bacterium]